MGCRFGVLLISREAQESRLGAVNSEPWARHGRQYACVRECLEELLRIGVASRSGRAGTICPRAPLLERFRGGGHGGEIFLITHRATDESRIPRFPAPAASQALLAVSLDDDRSGARSHLAYLRHSRPRYPDFLTNRRGGGDVRGFRWKEGWSCAKSRDILSGSDARWCTHLSPHQGPPKSTWTLRERGICYRRWGRR